MLIENIGERANSRVQREEFDVSSAEFGASEVALGEGNGTPLQYSCLEKPMDGGAW